MSQLCLLIHNWIFPYHVSVVQWISGMNFVDSKWNVFENRRNYESDWLPLETLLWQFNKLSSASTEVIDWLRHKLFEIESNKRDRKLVCQKLVKIISWGVNKCTNSHTSNINLNKVAFWGARRRYRRYNTREALCIWQTFEQWWNIVRLSDLFDEFKAKQP